MTVSRQSSSSVRGVRRSRGSQRGGGLFLLLGFALVVALSAGACYYLVTRKHGDSFFAGSTSEGSSLPSIASGDGPKKAKPSPYSKQDLAPVIPAPAPVTPRVPTSVASVAGSILPGMAAAPVSVPPLPIQSAGPWPAAGMSFTANHKGVRSGCKGGTLTINSAQLVFRCPTDVAKDVTVARSEVKAADDDGIELLSGKKYHFDIEGKGKDATHRMFVAWVSQP